MKRNAARLALSLIVMAWLAALSTSGMAVATEPTPLYVTAVDRPCEPGELSVLCEPAPSYAAEVDRPCEPGELSVLCESTPAPGRLRARATFDAARVNLAYRNFCRVLWITWRMECP